MKWVIEEKHAGMMIRDYLQDVHAFSRRLLKAVKFKGGKILVNGMPQTVRYCLVKGDVLFVHLPDEKKGIRMEPEKMPLVVAYEDDDLIIMDKPCGVATIPSLHHPTGTIANGLLGYYEMNHIPFTIHVVTRLDRDTSGLLLIAKHRYSHSLLAKTQQAGEVKRYYYAVVEGHLTRKRGTINAPIGRKQGSLIERIVTETGRQAITHYKVEKEFTGKSLINIELETGRTHQIRVHLASIGHPLLGDDLYGGSMFMIKRHALHCYKISFRHPLAKKDIHVQSLLPDDLNQLLTNTDSIENG